MLALLDRHDYFYLHPSKRWEYPWALQRARLAPGSRVLDAGCGASIFPVYLASRQMTVTALDPQVPAPAALSPELPVAYVCGALQDLPFGSGTFDAVFCISVIEHLPRGQMLPALAQLAAVLKPGGRLLLTTDYTRDAEEVIWYEGPDGRFRVDWNVFDRPCLESLLAGFDDLEMEGRLDLDVDWFRVRSRMHRFHGYPYTAVGIAFRKAVSSGR